MSNISSYCLLCLFVITTAPQAHNLPAPIADHHYLAFGPNMSSERQQRFRKYKNSLTPDSSRMSATQSQNLQQLQQDLLALQQGSQVTSEQKQALKNSLLVLAEGTTRPDTALVQQLATDLSTALTDQSLSNQEKLQLSNDLQAVMNSANIPKYEVEQAIEDAKAILTASNITQQDVQKIVNDLKAIGTEAKSNLQNMDRKRPFERMRFR